MGVTMETTMGKSGVTIEIAQMGRRVLPWRDNNEGEGCYHGDSTIREGGAVTFIH